MPKNLGRSLRIFNVDSANEKSPRESISFLKKIPKKFHQNVKKRRFIIDKNPYIIPIQSQHPKNLNLSKRPDTWLEAQSGLIPIQSQSTFSPIHGCVHSSF